MTDGVRFWPPNAPLEAGIHWVLLRAFAPPVFEALQLLAQPRVGLNVAARLGLLPRIFSRQPREVLRLELADCFPTAYHQVHLSVARGLALERALHIVDDVAYSNDAKYVLLKGSAIMRHLQMNLGLRGACDIDVLVSKLDAARVHRELVHRGFLQKTPTHPYYHRPTLTDTEGNAIEVHTEVPFFSLNPTKQTVSVQDLVDHGQLLPVSGLSACAHLPKREFLVAHCVVHGIAQHGYTPVSYPLLRMLADVIDLGSSGGVDLGRIETWVKPSVSRQELKALIELGAALSCGRIEATWQRHDGVGRLLRHLVLSAFDQRYTEGLKLYHALHLLRTFGGRFFLREYGRSTFALPDEDVARIYGSRADGREFWFKMMRPIDVARRVCAMLPGAGTVFARQVVGAFSMQNKD